jgi:hypothetical protein
MSSPNLQSPLTPRVPHLPNIHWPDIVVRVSFLLCIVNVLPFLTGVGTRDMLGATATLLLTFIIYNGLVFGIWEAVHQFQHVATIGKVFWGIVTLGLLILLGVMFVAASMLYGLFFSGTIV